jgi:invasion protein IalB
MLNLAESADMTGDRNVVRRVGKNHLRALLTEESLVGLPDGTAVAFSYWVKFCKSSMWKSGCFVGKDAKTVDGKPLVAAVVIQPNGEAEFLRLTFPITINRETGTRILFDGKEASSQTADFVSCKQRLGCMADYTDPETITRMRTARSMTLQATDGDGGVLRYVFALTDFAKAYDGPESDPSLIERRSVTQQPLTAKSSDKGR